MILKRYKNRVFQTIEKFGLNLSQFEVEDTEYKHKGIKHPSFKIKLKGSELFFIICQSENHFDSFFIVKTLFKPKLPIAKVNIDRQYMTDNDVIESLKEWIEKEVRPFLNETFTPDLWTAYLKSIQPLNFVNIDFEDNANFSDREKEQIRLGLKEIKILITQNFDFTKEQLRIINQRLSYLEEATNRLNKTDWKGIAISTIFSLILNLMVDTQTGQAILDLFKKTFENLPKLPF